MFRRKSKFILLLMIGLGLLAVAIPVFAAAPDLNLGLEYARASGLVDTDIRIIIARIINVALGLLGIVALALVIYGGYEYMTAAGDEEKITSAKKILINAAIGLAIILSAFAITQFVISKLTDAIVGNYCIEHPADCQPVTPPGGCTNPADCPGFFSFFASITPQGQLPLYNVVVRVNFYGGFSDKAVKQSTITSDNFKVQKVLAGGGLDNNYSGTFIFPSPSSAAFHPTGSCGEGNPNSDCFEKDTTYKVTLSSLILSDGDEKNLDCSGTNCVATFTTGNLYDAAAPLVSMVLPGEGSVVGANRNTLISARYSDDSGVNALTFKRKNSSGDISNIHTFTINPFEKEGEREYGTWQPVLANPDKAEFQELMALAFDLDNNQTTSFLQKVKVVPAYCFNGRVDGEKKEEKLGDYSQGIPDCGLGSECGACPKGACETSFDCAGTYCDPATKTCVVRPKITNVDKKDGAVGNYVTLFGKYFGAVPGQVIFRGGAGDIDDKAAMPVNCNGVLSWKDNYIVVAVPIGAMSGPLEVEKANAAGPLDRDATNDNWGPDFAETVFIVNSTERPGLCGVQPVAGAPNTDVTIAGTNLGATRGASQLQFGDFPVTTIQSWSASQIQALTPTVPAQDLSVHVKVGTEWSNGLPFKILPAAEPTGPQIQYIEPTSGPVGSYVTIFGSNFGASGAVRFKRTAEDASPITADLPPSYCSNSWSPTQIIVKVPEAISDEMSGSVTKNYWVEVDTAVGVSNLEKFEVNKNVLNPGLCLIEPNNGPAGTTVVTLKGEGFGANYGKVEYVQNVTSTFSDPLAFPRVWSNDGTRIVDKIPVDTKSGKVKVWADRNGGLYSNGLNFTVQNCKTDKTVACAAGTNCCDNGSCEVTCAAGPKSSVYAWSFSTGKLPVVPRVVEQCGKFCTESKAVCNKDADCKGGATDKCLPVTPSPAPWSPHWSGHDNVCVNANITLRFNTPINNDGTALDVNNAKDLVFVYACPDSACELKETNQLLSGSYVIGTWQSGNDKIVFAPKIAFPDNGAPPPADAFATGTLYQVMVTTKVRSDQGALLSANMPANPNCPDINTVKAGQQAAYCFKFKTRETKADCELGNIVIDPVTYTTSTLGKPTIITTDFYNLTPLASDIVCLGLNAYVYDWRWSPKSGESDYAEISNKDILPKEMKDGNVDPIQDLTIKDKPTPPGQPQLISAYWTEDRQSPRPTGKAYLYITPQKPRVEAYWPNCDVACINAEIGARFNLGLATTPVISAVALCQLSGDKTSTCESPPSYDVYSLSLRTTTLTNDTLIILPDTLNIHPADVLTPNRYYRVVIKGGPNGLKGENNLELDSEFLNYDYDNNGANDSYSWTFGTKDNANACDIDRVEMRPTTSTVYWIGQIQPFQALPFSAPDTCSSQGQRLRATEYNWAWSTAAVPPATLNATVTNKDLAPATQDCSANCLILPPKDPPKFFCSRENLTENCCGNGILDDGKNGNKDNNEECELREEGCDGKCQFAGSSYLYDPPSYCGDGKIGIGEACDPGPATDNKVEPLQYATAESPVNPTVGKNQYQTQIFAATTNPKTKEEKKGQADFILQCGYQNVNANCPTGGDTDKGVGSNSCCYPRPTVDLIQPPPSVRTNVCPNTAITLKFSELMDIASFSSSTLGDYNIILAEATSTISSCPTGQYLVDREELKPSGLWQKVVAFVRHLFGRPARAEIYCYGAVEYSLVSETVTETEGEEEVDKTKVSLVLKQPLKGGTSYKVIAARPWVKNLVGVSLKELPEPVFGFNTREDPDLCKIEKIAIDPAAWWFRTLQNEADDDPSNSDTFDKKKDIDKVFTARAYTTQNVEDAFEQELQQLEGVYSWTNHWSIDDPSIVIEGGTPAYSGYPTYKATSTVIVAQNKNGVTQVGATATIDDSSVIDKGSQYSASSTIQVFICENPWPDDVFNLQHPEFGLGYVDAFETDDKVLGEDPPKILGVGRGWTNFKLMYCRDAGKPDDKSDDLPELRLPAVLYHQ